MALLNIQNPPENQPFSLFVLAFRPFFLAAGIFSVFGMMMWMAILNFGLSIPMSGLSPYQWHAHEMIYGFTLAVVSGFLLTAIKNWTGVQTLQNRKLMSLLALWAIARVSMMFGSDGLLFAAVMDIAFNLLLLYGSLQPILQVKQWKQIGIVSKILLLSIANLLFYLGALGILEHGIEWGLIGGVFLLLALVLTLGRRVMPMFIQNGVGYPVQLKNSVFLDRASLILFLVLALSELFIHNVYLSSTLAIGLVLVSVLRLHNWHTPGIWRSALLWGLYVAFIFITLGFLIYALKPYFPALNRSMAIHTFTFGGIALITISMMSRVTLGHTGRDILKPSRLIGYAQGLIVAGTIIRVIPPIISPEWYFQWIFISQILWIAAFSLFVWVNLPLLTKPRVDGAIG